MMSSGWEGEPDPLDVASELLATACRQTGCMTYDTVAEHTKEAADFHCAACRLASVVSTLLSPRVND